MAAPRPFRVSLLRTFSLPFRPENYLFEHLL